jgi:hypothetical protein
MHFLHDFEAGELEDEMKKYFGLFAEVGDIGEDSDAKGRIVAEFLIGLLDIYQCESCVPCCCAQARTDSFLGMMMAIT